MAEDSLAQLNRILDRAGLQTLQLRQVIVRSARGGVDRLVEPILSFALRLGAGHHPRGSTLVLRVPRLPEGWKTIPQVVADLLPGSLGHDPSWVIISREHGYLVQCPQLGRFEVAPDQPADGVPSTGVLTQPDFIGSDVAMQVLAVILRAHAHRDWFARGWGGDSHQQYRSLTVSRTLTQVWAGQSSVYRVLKQLEDLGWIRIQKGNISHVDVAHIVGWWLSRMAVVPREFTDVDSVVHVHGEPSSWSMLDGWPTPGDGGANVRWAVTGWSVLRHDQLSIRADDHQGPLTVTVSTGLSRQAFLDSFGLVPRSHPASKKADLRILWAQHPQATFLGVRNVDGIDAVNVWQAALDVLHDRAHRGEEQARAVADRLWLEDLDVFQRLIQ